MMAVTCGTGDLASLMKCVTDLASGQVANLGLFIAAGIVVALGSNLVRRFIRAGR